MSRHPGEEENAVLQPNLSSGETSLKFSTLLNLNRFLRCFRLFVSDKDFHLFLVLKKFLKQKNLRLCLELNPESVKKSESKGENCKCGG